MSAVTEVVTLPVTAWDAPIPAARGDEGIEPLEAGAVLWLPHLHFALPAQARSLLTPAAVGAAKHISWDGASGRLAGCTLSTDAQAVLGALMQRYAQACGDLLHALLPAYRGALVPGRTSLRPVEIAERGGSWRKDDSRLHVDAFPSSPTQGRRILRVFSNVNPNGQARHWRLGEPFEAVARRFLPQLRTPAWGSGWLLQQLHVTKSRRTPYDHCMLQLHDRMKSDAAYQTNARQRDQAFGAGATWVVYTDAVPHAAMAGQHALEQTFYLPVAAMRAPERSPLRTLERLRGRALT